MPKQLAAAHWGLPCRPVMGYTPGVIDKDLLEILACPQTHQPLRMASAAELASLNGRIAGGKLVNKGGKPVEHKLEEALMRGDGKVLYPVRESIPMLLIDEGIET